jgi:hypothetical protein
MSYIFTFTPKESFNSKEMMENLSSQKDVQTLMKGSIGEELTVEFKLSAKISKKAKMYNFYHRVILGVAMECFTNDGWESVDKVKADYLLKAECGKGIMYNSKTDEEEIYLLDKARMNNNRLHKYLTDCITFLEVEKKYKVPDSASFVAEMQTGIKGFRSVNSNKSQ